MKLFKPLLSKFWQALRSWLPLFANNSLPQLNRWLLVIALRSNQSLREELGAIQAVRGMIKHRQPKQPSPELYRNIQRRIANQEQVPPVRVPDFRLWAIPLVLLFCAGLLLWLKVPPVISLGWSSQIQNVESFRVYRVYDDNTFVESNGSVKLLKEFPANSNNSYTFTEFPLLPMKEVSYRIDAVDTSGLVASTKTLVSDGIYALVGQLSLLMIVGAALYVFWFLMRHGLLGRMPSLPGIT